MSREDLPEARRLAGQLGYSVSEHEFHAHFAEITDRTDTILLVAKESGAVLGWAQIRLEPASLIGGPRAELGALIVDQAHRGRGIGKRLLARAEDWVTEQGFKILRLHSNHVRQDARRFYLREGYTLTKTSNVFVKELQGSPT